MNKILLLPLDDRPCNRILPAQIGNIADLIVTTPPKEMLGEFTTPADSDRLIGWIKKEAASIQAAIISVDMLCYGGLIASRLPDTSLRVAQQRLEVLRALKLEFPNLPIFAFNIIMRLSISADSPEKVEYWQRIALYSQLVDRVERLGQKRWSEALAAIQRHIPQELLDGYLRARERNHVINRAVVSLVADSVVDSALLLQEDAATFGLHIPEQKILSAVAEKNSVSDRVFITAGGDEGALVLLSRAALSLKGWRPHVAVYYGSREGSQRVSLFEDRPIIDNVKEHVAACGANLSEPKEESDLSLLVHTPTGPQQEPPTSHRTIERKNSRQATRIVKRASELIDSKRHVSIADIAYCNGGDFALVGALQEAKLIHLLAGYAGWNTSGNTIGTALTQGLMKSLSDRTSGINASNAAHVEMIYSRFVDDILYQSRIRHEANQWALDNNLSYINLGENRAEMEEVVRRRLRPLAKKLFNESFKDQKIGDQIIKLLKRLRIGLPWPRTFEVEIFSEIEVNSP